MKFSCSVIIDQSREKVVSYFFNPDLLHHFQDGFKSKTLLSGTNGEQGAKSRMEYEKLELIETVLSNDLPDEFFALYEHKYTTNTMKVKFEALSEKSTRYTSEVDYTEFNGLMIKIMAKLFPGFFKKQIKKWMDQFKNYCESN